MHHYTKGLFTPNISEIDITSKEIVYYARLSWSIFKARSHQAKANAKAKKNQEQNQKRSKKKFQTSEKIFAFSFTFARCERAFTMNKSANGSAVDAIKLVNIEEKLASLSRVLLLQWKKWRKHLKTKGFRFWCLVVADKWELRSRESYSRIQSHPVCQENFWAMLRHFSKTIFVLTCSLKVRLQGAKANLFLQSLLLLNVNIELDSLWTHLEVMSLQLSFQCKQILTSSLRLKGNLWNENKFMGTPFLLFPNTRLHPAKATLCDITVIIRQNLTDSGCYQIKCGKTRAIWSHNGVSFKDLLSLLIFQELVGERSGGIECGELSDDLSAPDAAALYRAGRGRCKRRVRVG